MVGHKDMYASEPLSLLCEWEHCTETDSQIDDFITHITQEHLVKISEGM